MKIIDISWPLSESATAYKDKKTIQCTPVKNFEQHNACESLITLSSHTGTHVDAPSHFLKDGTTIDQIPLESLCGPCAVVDMSHVEECITAKNLEKIDIKSGTIILFKTRNSTRESNAPFDLYFVYLDHSAAEYLCTKKIKAVGIDYLGIERNQPAHETHTAFMKNNISIIEGLRLQNVNPGNYTLICLPLFLEVLDGAPARAILIKQ